MRGYKLSCWIFRCPKWTTLYSCTSACWATRVAPTALLLLATAALLTGMQSCRYSIVASHYVDFAATSCLRWRHLRRPQGHGARRGSGKGVLQPFVTIQTLIRHLPFTRHSSICYNLVTLESNQTSVSRFMLYAMWPGWLWSLRTSDLLPCLSGSAQEQEATAWSLCHMTPVGDRDRCMYTYHQQVSPELRA